MNIVDISFLSLAVGYGLLIFPLSILLWYRIPIVGDTLWAIVRMTVQLLFVGLYLEVVFSLNNFWLNGAWLLIMIGVADTSITRGCGLRLGRFAGPLFLALLLGTAVPLFFFVGPILARPHLLDAQYAIPIGGMILGNCLRADIIGVSNFYRSVRKSEKAFLQVLAQGARFSEATRPFLRDAVQAALAPTVATMATIGLVSLPGMMTGVILGGADPMTAIKYQIAIMIAIFSGTAITVALAIWLTMKSSFTAYGVLDCRIFKT
ncbi:MAG: ABC transporter permease [Deltaproteobacteria bacterium]|nr:ABC transporter permease [Deltaproteobacteria bacterium]